MSVPSRSAVGMRGRKLEGNSSALHEVSLSAQWGEEPPEGQSCFRGCGPSQNQSQMSGLKDALPVPEDS